MRAARGPHVRTPTLQSQSELSASADLHVKTPLTQEEFLRGRGDRARTCDLTAPSRTR